MIHHEVRGDGAPLVLLHGLTGTGGDWAHVFDLDALAKRYRVILPDARGHGRSPATNDFSFRACAEDVLELLDALGIDRFRAIGASLGAKTLLHLATLAPARLEAMVLASATPRFPEATKAIMRHAATMEHSDEEWTLMRSKHLLGDDAIGAMWSLPARLADDVMPALDGIAARTLIVSGDRDPLYPIELAVELYRGIAGSSLFVIPGGGHSPIYGGWRETFGETALAFLADRLRS